MLRSKEELRKLGAGLLGAARRLGVGGLVLGAEEDLSQDLRQDNLGASYIKVSLFILYSYLLIV